MIPEVLFKTFKNKNWREFLVSLSKMSAQKNSIESFELSALYKTVTEAWFHIEQALLTKAIWGCDSFLSQVA